MSEKIAILFVLFWGLVMTSCKNKQERAILNLEELVSSAEMEADSLNTAQWDSREFQFEQLTSTADGLQAEMTDGQRKELNLLKGRFTALQLKRMGKEIGEEFENVQQQMEGFLEGISNDSIEASESK
jgi:hypothetical protein